jgi:hypothetical protein
MPDQQSAYLDLLDNIAKIEPSEQTTAGKAFAQLAEQAARQDDALELLLLAEHSMHARQWQAAAQFFARSMVNSFRSRDNETGLVNGATHIMLLTRGHYADLRSATDLLLYDHLRLIAALRADGMQQAHIDEWAVSAVSELLRESKDRKAVVERAVTELYPGNNRITSRYRAEIGPARQLLARSLDPRRLAADPAVVHAKGRNRNSAILVLAIFVIAVLSYRHSGLFAFPKVSAFLGDAWYGLCLRALLVAWPLLLVATWFFALFESIRMRTLYFVSPYHLIRNRVDAGEIMPFMRDWFFHIFQFVWIALLVVAWLIFTEYQQLVDWLPSAWSSAAQQPLVPFKTSLARLALRSNEIALAGALLGFAGSIWRQCHIQNQRTISHTGAYWWDHRIDRREWHVRLGMVGLDMALGIFLVLKILVMLYIVYRLVRMNVLTVWLFAPDGVGGLQHLTNMLMYVSWIVFVFGLLVFASLYLHWNLREYRATDFGLVCVYVVLVILAMVPLGMLESRFSHAKDVQLQQLVRTAKQPESSLEDAAKYVENVKAMQNWNVSALKIGILGNPVLPLGFQFVVVLFQALGRAGKLPKLPLPGLGEPEASKGGHDAA